MQTASAKAKGRLGQQEVAAQILAVFDSLTQNDIYSRPMSSPLDDLMLSQKALNHVYCDGWEIKRRSRIGICRWIEQVIKRKAKRPIVCFREDRKANWYCMLQLTDLLNLLKMAQHEIPRQQNSNGS